MTRLDAKSTPRGNLSPLRFDGREFAGAVADLGVLIPIAVALIVQNGLSATAVLLPAGLLYVAAGLYYRLPVSVQPLKAFGAIAIAQGLGSSEIAAGALLMGGIFVVLGASGLLSRVAKLFPLPIIRGVQLSVGLIFCWLAWKLTTTPPAAFADHAQPVWWLVSGALIVILAGFLIPRRGVALVIAVLTLAAIALAYQAPLTLGPSPIEVPELSLETFATAAVVLVLPQLPLTFANSCLATADAARAYFGEAARRVQPGRLAITLGMANLLAGAISGMPVCHGAGGMSAHYGFGARTGGTPIILGVALLLCSLVLGASLAAFLAGFPLPILAGLLAIAGLLHMALLKDLRHPAHWAMAIAVGVAGFLSNLAIALVGALIVWWAAEAVIALRSERSGPTAS
jgi:MFS superfamily sulfate permease-like transporter